MFYKLPLQIQSIEGALKYKIAPLTPPNDSGSKKTVKWKGIEPIKKSFYLCFLLSNTQFVKKQNGLKLN